MVGKRTNEDVKKIMFLKNKTSKVLVGAAILHLLLVFLLVGVFDVVSAVLYVLLAGLIGSLFTFRTKSYLVFFVLGALMLALYNFVGSSLGFFSFNELFLIRASIQQGVLAMLVLFMVGDD